MSGGALAQAKRAIRPRQRLDRRQPARDLRRPGEEVGLHDPVQPGRVLQLPPFQQPTASCSALPCYINAERRLHRQADHGGQVGMPHEQVVQPPPRPGHLPQRRPQQVVPQPPLHPHRLARRVPVVQRPAGGNVLFVMRIARTEVLLDALPVAQRNVLPGDQRPVPQPLVEPPPGPPSRASSVKPYGRRRVDRPGVGPAQQPIPCRPSECPCASVCRSAPIDRGSRQAARHNARQD